MLSLVELWVDSRVMAAPYLILGGGDRSTKLRVPPSLFQQTPNTEVVEGLAFEHEG